MSFTKNCFIRKNTPELREKLKEIGIPQNDLDDGKRPWIAVNYGYWITVDKGFDNLPINDIDCGTNINMFLALAALRNDTDINQWFICKEEYLGDNLRIVPVGEWQLNVTRHKLTYSLKKLWQKATAEEIIEHFNK